MLAFIYDLVVIQSLAGGDLPLKKGPFTTAHYEQKDKSLNNLLWELVPVHLSSMERKLRFGGLELRVACRDPPYPAAKLLAAAEAQESWAISANLDMLDLIHDFLKKQADGTFGPSPDDLLQTHSTQFVPRLSSLVPAVEQRKKKINVGLFASGHYVAAMFEYYKCILSLYPWIASPFIFSPEDAFGSGLAHLEATLYCNISLCAINLFTGDPYPSKTLVEIDRSCADVVITNMRYSSPKILAKAYRRASLICPSPLSHEIRGKDCSEHINDYGLLCKEAATNLADPESLEWTHRNCITGHVCFGPGFDPYHAEAVRSVAGLSQDTLENMYAEAQWETLATAVRLNGLNGLF